MDARAEVLSLLEELVVIGAPTFREKRRSDFVLDWLRTRVCAAAGQDSLGNVWADLSGDGSAGCLLDAHIDTVFPQAEVSLRKTGNGWFAPGVFDNTVTCAILMVWAARLAREGKRAPFLLSFTVGEEGEGDLCGIRKIAETFGHRLRAAVAFDLSIGMMSREAVGSLRYELGWQAAGGHSWNDFGNPSAIHLAARWIGRLERAFPWKRGERSFNVGTIQGGRGVNVIAGEATLKLDVRSTDREFLARFEEWLSHPREADGAPTALKRIGNRPAGALEAGHFLPEVLRGVHQTLGLPLREERYSTNGNALLDAGIPTLVTGLAEGGKIHTEAEFLNLASIEPGLCKLTLLAQRLAGHELLQNSQRAYDR